MTLANYLYRCPESGCPGEIASPTRLDSIPRCPLADYHDRAKSPRLLEVKSIYLCLEEGCFGELISGRAISSRPRCNLAENHPAGTPSEMHLFEFVGSR
jgi:hypothetical protein